MIVLDYKDSRPIYEQIVEKFSTLILRGVLAPDTQMPSVRSLAMELSVNPNTIQKAYSELERAGFTYVIKGRGAFVAGNEALLKIHQKECLDEIISSVNKALEFGIDASVIHQLIGETLNASTRRENK